MNKEAIKNWFKQKDNLLLFLVIFGAFIIRLIFFLQTYNQPVWWDEGEYLSMAKSFVYGIPFDFNPQRPFLLPAFIAGIFAIGLGEAAARFITVVLPSLGVVIAMYFLGKEMYDKKVGIIASFLLAVFWVALFNTTRVHTDMLALFFGLLSLYFFWKAYVKEKKMKLIWLFGLFLALGFMARPTTVLIGVAALLYVIITEHHKFLLKKELWFALIVFFLAITPLIFWNLHQYNTPFAQTSGYVDPESLAEKSARPLTWNVFNVIPQFLIPGIPALSILLVILLVLGIGTLGNFVIGFDHVLKNKDKKLTADFLTLILFLLPILYFLIIERPIYGFEPRWMIISAVGIFLFIGKGSTQLYAWLEKGMSKKVAVTILMIILLLAIIPQINSANTQITSKKTSYLPVKDAALWMKENSNPDEMIYTKSPTQTTYYAERYARGMPATYEGFVEEQKQYKTKFFVVSIFENHEDWLLTYPPQHPDEFVPVQGYMLSENQPALIVYEYHPKTSAISSSQ